MRVVGFQLSVNVKFVKVVHPKGSHLTSQPRIQSIFQSSWITWETKRKGGRLSKILALFPARTLLGSLWAVYFCGGLNMVDFAAAAGRPCRDVTEGATGFTWSLHWGRAFWTAWAPKQEWDRVGWRFTEICEDTWGWCQRAEFRTNIWAFWLPAVQNFLSAPVSYLLFLGFGVVIISRCHESFNGTDVVFSAQIVDDYRA